jgi:hypothetical protein
MNECPIQPGFHVAFCRHLKNNSCRGCEKRKRYYKTKTEQDNPLTWFDCAQESAKIERSVLDESR